MERHPDTPANEPCEPLLLEEAPPPSIALGGFQSIPWSWWEILLGLAPLVAAKIVVVQRAYSWLGAIGILAVSMGLCGWMLFFPLVMARRRHRSVMKRTSFTQVVLEALIGLALLPATYFLLFVALYVALVVAGERAMPQDALEGARHATSLSWPLLVLLLVACTVGPLAEEIFFRGFLLNALRGYVTLVPALVLQAALFAVLHFQATTNQIYLFLVGLVLGAVYLWRKTLWTPLFLHCFFNGVVMISLILSILRAQHAPYLGVSAVDRDDQPGCVLTIVYENSPAAEAGLKIGDVITALDDDVVLNFRHLIRWIRTSEAGQEITIHFERDGQPQETKATLRLRP